MNWTLYELVINLFQGFLFTWFITAMLTAASGKQYGIPYFSCSFLTAGALSTYMFFSMPEWDTWIFVFIIIYSFLFLKGTITQKAFWNLVLIVVSLAVTGLYYQIIQLILGVNTDAILQQTIYRIIFTISGNAFLWAVLFLLYRIFRNSINGINPSYFLLITDFLCALLIDLFFHLLNEQEIPLISFALGCLISLIIGVMTVVTHRIITRYAKEEQEYRYREMMMKETGAQIEDLKDIYSSMRRLRHDMNAYVRDVQQMIDSGELTAQPEYFDSLMEQLTPLYSTGNTTLDSVLSVKLMKFQGSGFEFRGTNLHYTGGMNITDAALCSLIANMLDNAYEALTVRKNQPGDHYVYLQFAYNPGGLMIICENPLLGIPPKMQKKSFFSRKTEPYHGLGISIMEKIVHDADGQFDIILSDDLFQILVLLPLSPEYAAKLKGKGSV